MTWASRSGSLDAPALTLGEDVLQRFGKHVAIERAGRSTWGFAEPESPRSVLEVWTQPPVRAGHRGANHPRLGFIDRVDETCRENVEDAVGKPRPLARARSRRAWPNPTGTGA